MDILQMDKDYLLKLAVDDVPFVLSAKEFRHIAKTLGALWEYDYEAAKMERYGMHARLKSDRHSDVFFFSGAMLSYPNIRMIMADQEVRKIDPFLCGYLPDYVGGIPRGATGLGYDVAEILGVKFLEMEKVDGKIRLITSLNPGESILLIEDFCTKGTGFKETIAVILEAQPEAVILPFDTVMLNRGGLKYIRTDSAGTFMVVAVVESTEEDWDAAECPLCYMGSEAIKPKETEENWVAITTSQLENK